MPNVPCRGTLVGDSSFSFWPGYPAVIDLQRLGLTLRKSSLTVSRRHKLCSRYVPCRPAAAARGTLLGPPTATMASDLWRRLTRSPSPLGCAAESPVLGINFIAVALTVTTSLYFCPPARIHRHRASLFVTSFSRLCASRSVFLIGLLNKMCTHSLLRCPRRQKG